MRAATASLPEGSGPHRFERRPAPNLVASFVEHLKRTGSPETFPGISLAELSKTEPFEKLADFELDGKRREDGGMAYCPMCRSPNKYLKGQLIYLPRLRAIAAIGHECADRRQQRYADREFRARKGQEKDENFLLDALRNVKALAQAYESLDETASAARDAHRQLKRKAPGLMGALRAVKGGGGRLRVYRDIPGAFASGSSGLWREEIVLGTLKGTIACTAAFNPAKEIDAIVQRLRACNFPDNSDEGILVYIVTLTEQERAFAVNAIRHAAAQLPRIRRRIEEFWSFFDAANLGLLAEWGAHDLQPEQFSLRSHGENGVLSVSILRQGEFARIVVDTRKFLRPETG